MAFKVHSDTRLGGVYLSVLQLEQSVDFYTTVLGLSCLHHDGNTAALTADGQTLLVHLMTSDLAQSCPSDAAGLRYFVLVLPDEHEVEKLITHLHAVGATFARQGSCLFVRDPSENIVAVVPGSDSDVEQGLAELEQNLRPS